MLDILKELPETVEVDGNFFEIKTDFRVWLQFNRDLSKEETNSADILKVFKNPAKVVIFMATAQDESKFKALIDALLKFFSNKNKVPYSDDGEGEPQSRPPVIDYDIDMEFIYADFMKTYGIDLMEAEMHWHKFQALFRGLFTSYSDIVGYRSYDGDDKAYIRLKHQWELPYEEKRTAEQQKMIDILLGDGDLSRMGV